MVGRAVDFELLLAEFASMSRAHDGSLLLAAVLTSDGVAVLSPADHPERVRILKYLLALHEQEPTRVVLIPKKSAGDA